MGKAAIADVYSHMGNAWSRIGIFEKDQIAGFHLLPQDGPNSRAEGDAGTRFLSRVLAWKNLFLLL